MGAKEPMVKSGELIDTEAGEFGVSTTLALAPTNLVKITGNNAENDPIMTIESDGEVIIHKPEQMGEAGDVFVTAITQSMDCTAGFKQSRYDWEEEFMMALSEFAKEQPLTAIDIQALFYERKVFNTLKGAGDDKED